MAKKVFTVHIAFTSWQHSSHLPRFVRGELTSRGLLNAMTNYVALHQHFPALYDQPKGFEELLDMTGAYLVAMSENDSQPDPDIIVVFGTGPVTTAAVEMRGAHPDSLVLCALYSDAAQRSEVDLLNSHGILAGVDLTPWQIKCAVKNAINHKFNVLIPL